MANSSIVRINNETKRTLEELSRKSGEPMLNVIDRAIEEYRRRVFLEETNAAYAKLKKDGKASGEYDREIAAWDSTLMDGLDDLESWEEGGSRHQERKGENPMINPARGEIWLADLNPARGHEQGGQRPVIVISADIYNSGPAGLVVVLPLTRTYRGIPLHVQIKPPDGGVKSPSAILCDAVRSISKDRLLKKSGAASSAVIKEIEDRMRILLEL